MYLLDRATKIDDDFNQLRSYLVEEGQIRYVTSTFKQWNRMRICMKDTTMCNGRVMLDQTLLTIDDFQRFQDRQKELIRIGCTTLAVAPIVSYESEIENEYKRTQNTLASSTLDYVIGLTVPVTLIRTTFIRKCQNLKIPFLRVELETEQELKELHWTHLSQTLLSYPLTIIPIFSSAKRQKALEELWHSYCSYYGIHTSVPVAQEELWQKPLLQKIGLYPQKGTLIGGSDADYLLFLEEKDQVKKAVEKVASEDSFVYDKKEPDVVVLKGEIIKVYNDFHLKPGFGKLIQVIRPGRFLALNGDEAYQQQTDLVSY